MNTGSPTDYVAAAIAYALINRSIETTSDVRGDFVKLLKSEYGVSIPKEIILPALRLLAEGGVINLQEDRYLPLVTLPSDIGPRTARWRFVEERTPASEVLHRFMDGPYDWMQEVLNSEEFKADAEDFINRELAQQPVVGMGEATQVADESDTELATAAVTNAPSAQIHVTINNSNQVTTTTADNPQSKSAARASWFSGWGTWAAAIIALLAFLFALHQAKVL